MLEDTHHLSDHIPPSERPVVFIGPYEHHSNEIPWRESIADVVTIHEDADGGVDQEDLRVQLEKYADRPLRIGSFSAASNVTGIVSDTAGISTLLHEHGALSFWDFAAAAPYIDIDFNAVDPDRPLAYKDAIFLSPHKFIGGPSTPGVLVARRELFINRVPDVPGGGTVAYVNTDDHRFLDDPTHREEGGTPAIIEAVRAGLVFQLKQAVGTATIREQEDRMLERAVSSWREEPAIELLGNLDARRLSIVSFVVRSPSGRYLHHNYVVALLNDLFGIQSRGGCSCAGPYGHRLLGIDIERSHEFEREIMGGCEGIKPGWVRVNLNYFVSDAVVDYIVDAVRLVARDGWRMMGDYRFDITSGRWRHKDGLVTPPLSLHDVSYAGGVASMPSVDATGGEDLLAEQLREGAEILAAARRPGPGCPSRQRERGLRAPAVVRPAGECARPGLRASVALAPGLEHAAGDVPEQQADQGSDRAHHQCVQPLGVAAARPQHVSLTEGEPDRHAEQGQHDRLAPAQEVADEQQRDAHAHREAAEVGAEPPGQEARCRSGPARPVPRCPAPAPSRSAGSWGQRARGDVGRARPHSARPSLSEKQDTRQAHHRTASTARSAASCTPWSSTRSRISSLSSRLRAASRRWRASPGALAGGPGSVVPEPEPDVRAWSTRPPIVLPPLPDNAPTTPVSSVPVLFVARVTCG